MPGVYQTLFSPLGSAFLGRGELLFNGNTLESCVHLPPKSKHVPVCRTHIRFFILLQQGEVVYESRLLFLAKCSTEST